MNAVRIAIYKLGLTLGLALIFAGCSPVSWKSAGSLSVSRTIAGVGGSSNALAAQLNSSSNFNYTISNNGQQNATALTASFSDSIQVESSNPTDAFEITGGTCNGMIPAQSNCSYIITFTPPSVGTFTANLTISFFDGNQTQTSIIPITATSYAPPPINVAATAGDGQNTLSWTPQTGATSYNIYFQTSAGVTTTASTKISGVTTPYIHQSLTDGTTYYYAITSVTDNFESSLSTEVSAMPAVGLAAPANVIATAGYGENTISWNAVTGASSYNLYWSTTAGVTTSSTKITGVTSPYAHLSLTNGTAYYYKVSAQDTGGEGPLSAEVSATPYAAAPTNIVATAGDGQVAVSWTAATGATSYNIYYSTNSNVTTGSTEIASATSGQAITGLTNGTLYYFAVTSVTGSIESGLSTIVSATPTTSLTAPVNVVATAGTSQNTISWNPVTNATSYNLYWSTTAGVTTSSTKITGVTSPYTQLSLTGGTPYYYKVSAQDAGGEGPLSSEVSATPNAAPPINVAAAAGDGQVTVTWTAAAGATAYNIYYSTSASVTTSSTKVASASSGQAITGLTNGTVYYFAVTSVTGSNESGISTIVNATPATSLTAPSNVVAIGGSAQNTISWNGVTNATSYNLYWSTTAGVTTSSTKISGVTSSYVQSSLSGGTAYYYKVSAQDAGGEGPLSSEVSATPFAPPPTNVVASGGDGQVTVTWTAATGATAYNLYYATNSSVTTSSTKVTGATSGVATTGLTNGTTYYFAVTSVTNGNESALSTIVNATPATSLAAPANVVATAGSAQNSISWNAVTNATSYNLYWSTTAGVTTSSTKISGVTSSYVQSSLSGGTAYYYKVSAQDAGGEGPLSSEVSATPFAPPPTNVAATAGDGQATITWTAATGATSYNIYYSTSASVTTSSTKVASATSGQAITGLTNGTVYYFAVTSVTSGTESALSTMVSATPATSLTAPVNVVATAGTSQNTISWNAVTNATSYNLYWSTTAGVTTSSTKITGVTSPYVHLSLTAGTPYYYKVSAQDAGGEGPLSSEVSATPNAPPPTNVAATAGDGQVTMSWTAATGATAYNIYYSTSASVTTSSTKVASATSGQAITGLTNGTTYYFAVTSVTGSNESAVSTIVNATPATGLSAPANVIATAASGQNSISWNAVTNATSYNLYWSTTAGVTTSSTKITGVTSPYGHLSLTNGTTYYYKVSAVDAGGEGPLSSEVSAMPFAPPPTNVAAAAGDGQVTVSWTAATGATSYNIYYSTSASVTTSSTKVASATSGQAVTGLTNGTVYYFAVTSVTSSTESGISSIVNATPVTSLSAPANVVATAGSAQNTISWNAVTNATSYNLYWSTTAGVTTSSTKITAVTSPYAHTSLNGGTAYYYKVSAQDAGGEGPLSSEVSATPYAPPPTNVVATGGDGQVTVSWTAAIGATSYNLYYATTSNVTTSSTKITGATSGGATTGLTNGTTYYFAVTSMTNGTESALSTIVNATPTTSLTAPASVIATAGSAQNTVSWNAVTNATSYNLYWSTTAGVTTSSTKISGVSSPYTPLSLTNGTTYYYKISAVDTGGEGPLSSEVSAMPFAAPPTNLVATATDGQVTLTWTAATGASSYNLYYSTSSTVTTSSTKVAGATSGQVVSSLTDNTLYYFAVTSVTNGTESALSSTVSATPEAVPSAPTLVATAGTGQNSLSWSAVTNATSYNLYWSTTAGVTTSSAKITGVTSPYVHSSLTTDTTYYYRLSAVDETGEGALSSEVSATPVGVLDHFTFAHPSSTTAGAATTLTVTANDAAGNTVTNFTGTVTLTSSDGSASLPSAYTFQSGDLGVHQFALTFNTTGSQTATATSGIVTLTSTNYAVESTIPLSVTVANMTTAPDQSDAYTIANGVPPYTVSTVAGGSISNPSGSGTFLADGSSSAVGITVTDSLSNTASLTITVNQPLTITLSQAPPNLPQPSSAPASTVWNGKMYLFSGSVNGLDSNLLFSYSPTLNVVRALSPSGTAPTVSNGSQFFLTTIGNLLYAFTYDGSSFHISTYDPTSGTDGAWTSLAPSGSAPNFDGTYPITEATVGSKMYLFGFYHSGSYTPGIKVFDPSNGAQGAWSSLSPSGSGPQTDTYLASTVGGNIYLYGNSQGGVYSYNPTSGASGAWTKLTPAGAPPPANLDKVTTIAAAGTAFYAYTQYDEIFAFDTSSGGTWTNLGTFEPGAYVALASQDVNGEIYFYGSGENAPWEFDAYSPGGTSGGSNVWVPETPSYQSTSSTLESGEQVTYTVSGGTGPYTVTKVSGYFVSQSTSSGIYGMPNVGDTLTVTDSLQNSYSVTLTPGTTLTLTGTFAVAYNAYGYFTASGGDGSFTMFTNSGNIMVGAQNGSGASLTQTFIDSTDNCIEANLSVEDGNSNYAYFNSQIDGLSIAANTSSLIQGLSTPYTLTNPCSEAVTVTADHGTVDQAGNYQAPSDYTGTVTLTAYGFFGNVVSTTLTVTADPAINVSLGDSHPDDGGSTTIDATGGDGIYTITAQNGTVVGTTYRAPASGGSDVITVTDSDGNQKTYDVTLNSNLSIAMASPTMLSGLQTAYTVANGTPPYSVSVSSGATVSNATGSGNIVADGSQSSVTLSVTDAASASSSFTVSVVAPLYLGITQPPANFGADYAASTTCDGKMFVFGGMTNNGLSNAITSYDPNGNAWRVLTPSGTAPTPREYATAGCLGNKVYVFGGFDGSTPLNQLYLFDPTAGSFGAWSSVTPAGSAPVSREYPASVVISGKMYVFGGENASGQYLNDLYVYDPATGASGTWTALTPTGNAPSVRIKAIVGVISGKMVVQGGDTTGNTPVSDFYAYDPTNGSNGAWSSLSPSGTAPSGEGTATVINNKLYVLQTSADPNQMFIYDPSSGATGAWMSGGTFESGNPRYGAVSQTFNNEVFFFGGGAAFSSELSEFDPNGNDFFVQTPVFIYTNPTLESNQSIAYEILGGTSPYTVTGHTDNASGSGNFTMPASGLGELDVTDSSGQAFSIDFSNAQTLAVTMGTTQPYQGSTTTYTISGGVGPFSVSTQYGSVDNASGSGNYTAPITLEQDTLTVSDSDGYIATVPINNRAYPAISINISQTGLNINQTEEFTVTGGSGSFDVQAQYGSITLAGGNTFYYAAPSYATSDEITVTDNVSQVQAEQGITVENLSLSVAPGTELDVSELATITVSGGNGQYTYQATRGMIDQSGNYQAPSSSGSDLITVTDSLGVSFSEGITVDAALSLPPTMTVDSGASSAVATSGSDGSYTYSATYGSFTGDIYTAPGGIGNPSNDTITVTDGNGVTTTITVTLNSDLSATVANSTLAVGQITSYSVSGGTSPYQISAALGSVSNATDNGNYNAVTTGSDTLMISDSGGGSISLPLTIYSDPTVSAPAYIAEGATITATISCPSGSCSSSDTLGGTFSNDGTYTAPMSTGTDTLTLTDDVTNAQGTTTITVVSPVAVSFASAGTAEGSLVSYSVSGGSGSYSVSVDLGAVSNASGSGTYTASGGSGTATLTAVDTASSFSQTATIAVGPPIYIGTASVPSSFNFATSSPSAVIGSMLYVFGGYVGGGTQNYLWSYDQTQNLWTAIDAVNLPSTANTGAMVMAASGSEIYLCGSWTCWSYDPATNVVTSLSGPTSTPQSMFTIGGKLYLTGLYGSAHLGVFVYDPSQGSEASWSQLAPSGQTPGEYPDTTTALISGKIYVQSISNTSLYMYDPSNGSNGSWTTLTPSGTVFTNSPVASAVMNGKWYVVSSNQELFQYDPAAGDCGAWSEVTALNFAYDSMALMNSKLYLLASTPSHLDYFDGTNFTTVTGSTFIGGGNLTIEANQQIPYTIYGGTRPFAVTAANGSVDNPSGSGNYTMPASGGDTLTVTDGIGLVYNITMSSGQTLTISVPATTVASNGSLDYTVTGGYEPSVSAECGTVSNPSGSGTYTPSACTSDVITVTDGNDYSVTADITITYPALTLTIGSESLYVDQATILTVSGGSGDYSLSASYGTILGSTYTAPGSAVSDLITVTDNVTEASTSSLITVSDFPAISVSLGSSTVTPSGSTSVSVTGGSGNFTLSASLGSVSGGTYYAPSYETSDTVTATDTLTGLTGSASVTVAYSPLSITLGAAAVSPGGTTSVSASGGSGSYLFSASQGYVTGSTYTAPGSPTNDTITVTDTVTGDTASAGIAVDSNPTLSPSLTSLEVGQTTALNTFGGTGPMTCYADSVELSSCNFTPSSGQTGSIVVSATDVYGFSGGATVYVYPVISYSIGMTTIDDSGTTSFSIGGSDGSETAVAQYGSINSGVYTAPASGTSDTITITDDLGGETQITITLSNVVLSFASTSVAVSETTTYTVSGGVPPYSISSVSGSLSNATGSGTYTARTQGMDTITCTDSGGGFTQVEVLSSLPGLSGLPSYVAAGASATATVSCSGQNCSATSANGGTTSIAGYVYNGSYGYYTATLTYTAPSSLGVDTITLTDNDLAMQTTATTTVLAPLQVGFGAASVAENGTISYTVGGGSGSYSLSCSNCTLSNSAGSGTLTAGSEPGVATVSLTDEVSSLTQSAQITVSGSIIVLMYPEAVAPGETSAYYIQTDTSGGLTVSVDNGSLNNSTGNGTYTAPDSSTIATITVTDAQGNTGTATVSVNTPGTWQTADTIPSLFSASGQTYATTISGTPYVFTGDDSVLYTFNPSTEAVLQLSPSGSSPTDTFYTAFLTVGSVGYLVNTSFGVWTYDPSQGTGGTWTHLAPTGAPTGSSYLYNLPTAAVLNDKIYVFGGDSVGSGSPQNELYVYDPNGGGDGTWTLLSPAGTAPSGTSNANLMTINDKLYLYLSDYQEIFIYDPTTGAQGTWTEVSASGSLPAARAGEAVGAIGDVVYVFGGWNVGSGYPDTDSWSFDTGTNTWAQLSPSGIHPPSQSYGHPWNCSITVGSVAYFFLQNYIVSYDSSSGGDGSWGPTPPATIGSTAATIGTVTYVFGGSLSTYDNQLYAYDNSQSAWSLLSPSGTAPAGRIGHSAAATSDKMYVFGGRDGSGTYHDLYSYDPSNGSSGAWTQLSPSGPAPSARSGHTAVMIGSTMYVFGGWDGTTSLNDLYAYDTVGNTWTNLTSSVTGSAPSVRNDHTAVAINGLMYVFGGTDGTNVFNDLYVYDPSSGTAGSWTSLSPAGVSLIPRFGHVAVSLSVNSGYPKMYVFGGQTDSDHSVDLDSFTTAIVYVYDPNENTWTAESSGGFYSPTGIGISSPAVWGYGSNFNVFGGNFSYGYSALGINGWRTYSPSQ